MCIQSSYTCVYNHTLDKVAAPNIKPFVADNIGHSDFKNIYIKMTVWYNEIK